jgi:hypothetical protein
MRGFEMPKLNETITDKRKDGYIINEHYKYFTNEKPASSRFFVSKIFVKMVKII